MILEVDSLNGQSGPEEVPVWASEAGTYRIEGEASSAGTEAIPARVSGPRKARPADETLWRAASLTWQGKNAADPREKRKLFLEARRLYTILGERQGRADLSYRSAQVFEELRLPAEALRAYREAKDLYRGLPDRTQYLITLQNLADLLRTSDELEEAQEVCREGLEALQPSERAAWRPRFLVLVALSKLDRGEPEAALDPLEEALTLRRASGDLDGSVEILNSLGRRYFKLGVFEKAVELHQEALRLLGPRSAPGMVAQTFQLLGNAFLSLGDGGRAFFHLQWAAKIFGSLDDASQEATTSNSLARLAYIDGDLPAALDALNRAISLYDKAASPADGAQAMANAAWIYTALGHPTKALEAADAAEKRAGEEPRAGLVAFLHLVRARAFGQAGELDRAVREARTGLERVETRRKAIEEDQFRMAAGPGLQLYYEVAIESLMALQARDPAGRWNRLALEVSERAHARSLLDSLAGVPSEPDVTADEIQGRLLDSGTVLLEIFVGSRVSYLWEVSRDGLRSFELPGRQRLTALARRVAEGLPGSDEAGDLRPLHRQAQALSRALFLPLERLPYQDLVLLVLPAELQTVPIAALPNPFLAPDAGNGTSWPNPLLLDRAFVVEPSMAVLAAQRRQRAVLGPPGPEVAVFADPRYSPKGVQRREPRFLRCQDGPVRLPPVEVWPLRFGRAEARKVGLAAGGAARFFVGPEASVDRFRSLDLDRFRYLYFSAHGRSDEGDAQRSAIVLSAFDAAGAEVPACLFAHDIAERRFPADLVMLSACDSGLGKVVPGEGVLGLPQAFLTAGAAKVGVALWRVQEGPTSALMDDFHRRYLGQGVEPIQALRAAQLALWSAPERTAPAYWAGFQLLGDWR